MTDKVSLIDAEIRACRSKLEALGGRDGILLRSNQTGLPVLKPLPRRPKLPPSEFLPPILPLLEPQSEEFKNRFGNVINETFKAEKTNTLIYFKTLDDYLLRQHLKDSKIFNQWVEKACTNFHVNAIVIQSMDMFGPTRIGFIKLSADLVDKEGTAVPSIVFLRGGSVAILILIECDDGNTYSVLTDQARVPIGKRLYEIPAGMLDGSGNFSGVAAKEMEEETGIQINVSALQDLTAVVYGGDQNVVYPSSGGCDETMTIFLYETKMTLKEIKALHNKHFGEIHEGEKIRVHVVPFFELARSAQDMKTLSALALYYAMIDARKRREALSFQKIYIEK